VQPRNDTAFWLLPSNTQWSREKRTGYSLATWGLQGPPPPPPPDDTVQVNWPMDRCACCNDDVYSASDPLVACEGCQVVVHQVRSLPLVVTPTRSVMRAKGYRQAHHDENRDPAVLSLL
jgi:hypothetical protein